MDTKSIIKSLELATCQRQPVPSQLIKLVEEALEERDELSGRMETTIATRAAWEKAAMTVGAERHALMRAIGLAPNDSQYVELIVWHSAKREEALKERDRFAVENEKLRAALSVIVTANAACEDMTQPLEDATRLMGG